MASVIEESFKVNLWGMKIFGLYPPDKHKGLYKVGTYIMYLLFIVPVPILESLNLFLQENLSFRQFADNAFLIAELGCFIPKFWPFVINGERIKRCIHYFDSPKFAVKRPEHEEIIQKCIKMCRNTTALFLASVTAGFISWSSRPISWKNHIFPTDLWLPFDPQTAPKSYICCVYTYLVLAVGYGAFTSGAVDPLIAGLAYQATSQIKILKDTLQHLGKYADKELATKYEANSSEKGKVLHAKIKNCVDHHSAILIFVKEYEECFSQVAFSQFVGGVMVLCVSCLQLTIVEILSFDFLAMVMYLIAMLSEIYLYCHFGTELYEESNTISQAIYMGNWYEYDIRSQRDLAILMERAKRPMIVTCGKIFDVSVVTFTMILRRAYSLLAVLENYNMDLN
ncbi:odorant receptor Or1-like [Tenebrio molitor]|uniref:odorant receptor Or1-like n=1 Tax=Tenebrio molitor TaxID=7067 RepID=UPI00362497FC